MRPAVQIPLNDIGLIAVEAGKAIMNVYNDPANRSVFIAKEDHSPLTIADKESHRVIVDGLSALGPQLPVLSEEGAEMPFEERRHWEYYWCVDPLDGTKEFLKRNGEFTVNIALMHRNKPVAGVIYVPVTGELFSGSAEGSFKTTNDGATRRLIASVKNNEWTAVSSRSHASPEEVAFLSKYPVVNTINAGSSLKFCLIAEGRAHVYYRHGPTMEWDTAAGQAIAMYSGADVTLGNGDALIYNKPSLRNDSFVCRANKFHSLI